MSPIDVLFFQFFILGFIVIFWRAKRDLFKEPTANIQVQYDKVRDGYCIVKQTYGKEYLYINANKKADWESYTRTAFKSEAKAWAVYQRSFPDHKVIHGKTTVIVGPSIACKTKHSLYEWLKKEC